MRRLVEGHRHRRHVHAESRAGLIVEHLSDETLVSSAPIPTRVGRGDDYTLRSSGGPGFYARHQ